ncbi:MAG TPA: inner membrane protein YhjD [Nakamurella multipartita]|nr:inner membrane protein YhjD [Nakamurella multipartita]
MVTTPERTAGKGPVPQDPPPVGRLVLLGKRIASRPGIKHLIAAITRYGDRLGSQFAGAMTYFSFLSLVPILMVGFSVGGIVLRNNQELLARLESEIAAMLPSEIADPIVALIDSVVANPLGVGIVGLLIALYSGIGWMGNLRKAVRALWGKQFETGKATADNLVVGTLKDLGALAGLAVAIVVSLGLSAVGSQFASAVADLLGLGDQAWLVPVLTVTTILIAMAADVLIFMWVYTVLPPKSQRSSFKARLRGSIVAAIGFEILKYALTTILPAFTGTSRTAAIFGPVIGLLFFFNLVAQLVLFVAAWVATADGGADDDDHDPLPEVPEATIIVRKEPSRARLAALVGVGAALGWGAGRRKE